MFFIPTHLNFISVWKTLHLSVVVMIAKLVMFRTSRWFFLSKIQGIKERVQKEGIGHTDRYQPIVLQRAWRKPHSGSSRRFVLRIGTLYRWQSLLLTSLLLLGVEPIHTGNIVCKRLKTNKRCETEI